MFVHGFLLGWQRLVYSEIIFWHSCVTSLLGKVGQYHHFVKTEAVWCVASGRLAETGPGPLTGYFLINTESCVMFCIGSRKVRCLRIILDRVISQPLIHYLN